MPSPIIGISAWTRAIDTALGDGERHYTLAGEYVDAVVAAGGIPVVLPAIAPDHAADLVEHLDGLVISGGNDIDPARYGAPNESSVDLDGPRDAWELALVLAAKRRFLPTLGICRGAQLINVAHGGTLHQHVWNDDSGEHPTLWNPETRKLANGIHEIWIERGSRLETIYGKDRRTVNSLHHQAIDRVGEGIVVSARATDGFVEAIEATSGWTMIAVQWHPERLDLSDEMPLFEAFVADTRSGGSA